MKVTDNVLFCSSLCFPPHKKNTSTPDDDAFIRWGGRDSIIAPNAAHDNKTGVGGVRKGNS